MLGQIKGIKMMGLTNHFHTLLRGLRIKEIVASEKLRWLIVSLTTLGKDLSLHALYDPG